MNFVERLQQSLTLLWEYLPALLGAGVVLLLGYILAKLVQKGIARLLRRLHLNEWLRRGGVMSAVDSAATHFNPSRVVAHLAFWVVMFTAMLVAANALGIDSLAPVFSELVGYVPSVIAAIVIVILGIVLGDFVSGLIMASTHALHGGPTLARAGKAGVVLLAVFMALQELGVATNIVTTAFAIIFGAVVDDAVGDQVRVTVVAAGFDRLLPSATTREGRFAKLLEGSAPATPAPASAPAEEPVPAPSPLPSILRDDDEDDVFTKVSETVRIDEDDLDIPDFLKH